MSELKWNWVYYPYLDAPNEQEESALKAGYIKVVIKDEADKVIAELKRACNSKDDWCLHTLKENRHQKYKRCLAMALLALEKRESYKVEYEEWCLKWYKRWLELAERFKEAK